MRRTASAAPRPTAAPPEMTAALEREVRLRPRLTQHGYLHLRQLSRDLRRESKRVGDGVVLDIGCGAKPYAPLFTGRYVGVDLSQGHGAPDALGAAERLPIASRSVDVVLSTQQLEHVSSPDAVLAEAHRVLRPHGTLLLSTHGVWPYHPDPHDLWRWTEEGLTTLIERHGFEVEAVHHQGELFAAAAFLGTYPLGGLARTARGLRGTAARCAVALVNLVTLALERSVAPRLPRHYASPSYLVVGHRRAPK